MSVWEGLKVIPEWPARYFFTVAAVAGLLLLLSATRWAEAFGFAGAPRWARLALTVTTVACSAVGAMKVWAAQAEANKRAREDSARSAVLHQELLNLTPAEREVFAQFIEHDRKTAGFVAGDASASIAHALALRGHLIHIEEQRTGFYTVRTYMIQEPIFHLLKRHPEALVRETKHAPKRS